METEITQNKKKRIPAFLRLLTLWLVITALCLAVTRAWVSKNSAVSDSGIGFSLDEDLLDQFYGSGSYLIITDGSGNKTGEFKSQPNSSILPGYSDDFCVGLFNSTKNSTYNITEFGLETPTIYLTSSGEYSSSSTDYDENPVRITVKEGDEDKYYYYYLGQYIELSVSAIATYKASLNDSNDVSKGIKLDESSKTSIAITSGDQRLIPSSQRLLSDSLTAERIQMVVCDDEDNTKPDSIELGPGYALVLTIHIEFVKTDASGEEFEQNMFVNFGPSGSGGRCHRSIYATYTQKLIAE